MNPDDEEREQDGGSGDIFEDLDKFFAPIEESELPGTEGRPAGRESTPAPAEAAGEYMRGGRSDEPEGPAIPVVSSPGGPEDQYWRAASVEEEGRGDAEESESQGGEEPQSPWGEEPQSEWREEPQSDGGEEPETAAGLEGDEEGEPPGEPPPGEPPSSEPLPSEMTGQDWTRLRDVLGEEEDEEDFGFPSGDVPADETLYGYGTGRQDEEEGVEESQAEDVGGEDTGRLDLAQQPGDLTIDDLRQAPPEYAGLPGAEEEETGLEGAESAEREQEEAPLDVFAASSAGTEEPEDILAGSSGVAAGEEEEPWPPVYAEVPVDEEEAWPARPSGVEEDLLPDLEPAEPRTVRVGSEPLTGPTWEEPTSRAIMSESSRGPAVIGRSMPAAVLSAVILAVVALIALALKPWLFALVAILVVLLGQAELYATMQRRNYQPATALGLVLGGLTMAAGYLKGEQAMLFVVGLGLVLTLLWYMAAVPKARAGMVGNVGATMLGLIYVPFLAGYVLVIETLASGRALVLAVLGLPILYDIAAMFFGSFWGSRPLAPTISPKKSWEGLLGATIVTFAVSIAFVPLIDLFSVTNAILLALLVVIFAPLGDLAESAIKRDLGVKDMGTIIPGHGGVLDRIDSLIFVAPAAFYFLRIVFRA